MDEVHLLARDSADSVPNARNLVQEMAGNSCRGGEKHGVYDLATC